MTRTPRVHVSGAIYLIQSNGIEAYEILKEDASKALYLEGLHHYCQTYGCEILSYALQTHHAFLLLKIGHVPLSKVMQCVQQAFTKGFNKRKDLTGPVFKSRYEAIMVKPERLEDAKIQVEQLGCDVLKSNPCLNHLKALKWLGQTCNKAFDFEQLVNFYVVSENVDLALLRSNTKIKKITDIRRAIMLIAIEECKKSQLSLATYFNLSESTVSKVINHDFITTPYLTALLKAWTEREKEKILWQNGKMNGKIT